MCSSDLQFQSDAVGGGGSSFDGELTAAKEDRSRIDRDVPAAGVIDVNLRLRAGLAGPEGVCRLRGCGSRVANDHGKSHEEYDRGSTPPPPPSLCSAIADLLITH